MNRSPGSSTARALTPNRTASIGVSRFHSVLLSLVGASPGPVPRRRERHRPAARRRRDHRVIARPRVWGGRSGDDQRLSADYRVDERRFAYIRRPAEPQPTERVAGHSRESMRSPPAREHLPDRLPLGQTRRYGARRGLAASFRSFAFSWRIKNGSPSSRGPTCSMVSSDREGWTSVASSTPRDGLVERSAPPLSDDSASRVPVGDGRRPWSAAPLHERMVWGGTLLRGLCSNRPLRRRPSVLSSSPYA